MKTKPNAGIALLSVVGVILVIVTLGAGIMMQSLTHMTVAGRQVDLEQAFYTAEGGAERTVAYIRYGGAVPGTLTGTIGRGSFVAMIIGTGSGNMSTGATHTLGGDISINPNNSPDNEFMLLQPDGGIITRDDLQNDSTSYTSAPCVYYTGPAILIHVKPHGNGNQNTFTVDGAVYTLDNSTTYNFASQNMNVQVYNDSRNNGNGQANGQWWVGNINATGASIDETTEAGLFENYSIYSIGTAGGARRMVVLDGVHQQSWARYALWYDHSGGSIYFIGGETINGPVHSNTRIYLQDNPLFRALVTSATNIWGQWSAAAVFELGYLLGAPRETMASVVFSNMLADADLVITGLTSISLNNTNLVVSNSRQGWTNQVVLAPTNGVVYVRNAPSGAASNAVVIIGGTLQGALTIVTEDDFYITNHIRYATHPTNGSSDALGLIASSDVIVRTNVPYNLNIYSHIIAGNTATNYNAGFYVQNYNTRSNGGNLTVYGGIVQNNRGAVGQGSSGFRKNYIYDTRFATNPPPSYPTVTNEYYWNNWRDVGAQ